MKRSASISRRSPKRLAEAHVEIARETLEHVVQITTSRSSKRSASLRLSWMTPAG